MVQVPSRILVRLNVFIKSISTGYDYGQFSGSSVLFYNRRTSVGIAAGYTVVDDGPDPLAHAVLLRRADPKSSSGMHRPRGFEPEFEDYLSGRPLLPAPLNCDGDKPVCFLKNRLK
jgi:hypothetical protein